MKNMDNNCAVKYYHVLLFILGPTIKLEMVISVDLDILYIAWNMNKVNYGEKVGKASDIDSREENSSVGILDISFNRC